MRGRFWRNLLLLGLVVAASALGPLAPGEARGPDVGEGPAGWVQEDAVPLGQPTWSLETVDSLGNVGQYTSIALDAQGFPHIAYYDASSGDLKYAYKDGSGWHQQAVDSAGVVG